MSSLTSPQPDQEQFGQTLSDQSPDTADTSGPTGPSRRSLLTAGATLTMAGLALAPDATAAHADSAGVRGGGSNAASGAGAAPANPAGPANPADSADPSGTKVAWHRVRAQLAAANPAVSAPITGVVSNKYTPGMLLANGDLGAVVGDASATQQTFRFGKSDFWGSARRPGQTWQESILAAGLLTVAAPGATAAPGYAMTTDLAAATVTTVLALSGVEVRLRSWIPEGDSVLVTEISSPLGAPDVPLTAQAVLPVDPAYPCDSGVAGKTLWTTRQNNAAGYFPTSLTALFASATRLLGRGFANATSATSAAAPGTTGATGTASATGTFTLRGGEAVTLVTVFRSHAQDTSTPTTPPTPAQLRDQAVAAAAAIDRRWLAHAREAHDAFWRDFWTRSSVVLGDSQLETYYLNAQYVLGSASRPGYNPPSLWGQWVTNDTPQWGGRYFLNYNEEALYYGAFASNHADLTEPYRRLIFHELPWQRNITAAAGYQGATFIRSHPFHLYQASPAPTPVAAAKDWTKLPADQKSNGTFAALPLIWHWEYTRDREYLRTQLYPLLKELDAFWRDFAVWDGTRWVIQHSSAHEGGDDTNPNLDLGFARKVINTLIQTSAILGVDADLVPTWQSFLDKLSAYPTGTVNGVTVFYTAEVINNPGLPDLFEPGNQPINMEGVIFPGEQCSIGGDPTLLRYAINSLTQMDSWGVTPGGNSNNGFCKEFAIAARVGWPAEDLVQKLKASIGHLWRATNNTVFQGGGGVETTGTTEAVHSMLMQSEGGVIRVFPCWPAARDASFVLLAKGNFLVAAAQKGGVVDEVTVTSRVGGPATIALPWATGRARVVDGRRRAVPSRVEDGLLTFATRAGDTYRIIPA